jgi:peptide/nickel transport system ATP-binding protein
VQQGLLARSGTIRAVADVSLRVERGGVLGLVGESGCGKSTLARLLLGLEPPDRGEVLLDGQAIASMGRRELGRKIQIVFQDPNSSLNPRKTLASIVGLPLRIHGVGDARTRARQVAEMLDLVGLPRRLLGSLPAELSGGQRQRVAIARALILRPAVVVCDEPTSALDVSVQSQILNLLQDLRGELGLTFVIISHNLAVVEYMATRVAVMYLGRIVEETRADALFAGPRHPYTRVLLDSVLTPDPDLGLPDVALGAGTANPLAPPPGCPFHTRCPVAMPVCARQAPAVRSRQPDGLVACHLDDLQGASPR